LNEKVASEIEDMYRQATRDDYDNTYAVVRVRKGRAVIEDVMIQGKSIETLVGELRK
jgi:orotate phosphoribosyltransferase